MVKFEGKIGTLYHTIFNAQKRFLKNSPHDVQIKGGGVKGLLNNVKKNCTFLTRRLALLSLSLCVIIRLFSGRWDYEDFTFPPNIMMKIFPPPGNMAERLSSLSSSNRFLY